jgi:hypothetical protein
MHKHERAAARRRQLDLLVDADGQPQPQLPTDAVIQMGQLLKKLLIELIDAGRTAREKVDE